MKLLFVIGSLQGGGAEHVLTTICNNLALRGHEVILIYDFKWKVYNVEDAVRQIDSQSFEHSTKNGNIFNRYYNKFMNRIRAYRFFKRLLRNEKPDAVTCFLHNWAWQLALICQGKTPLVYSERNTFDWNYRLLADKIVKKVWYHFGDAITVMTYYDKAYLHNRYKKVYVMHNPLSYLPLTENQYIKTFEHRKNILACGRLVEDKGFDKLIEAFSYLKNEFPDWSVDIAGQDMQNSTYSQYLKKLVKEHELEDNIRFIGFHKDMNRIMEEHSIFCLCSQHEGFPNVLSEALSMGMAVISFDIVTGPREIVIDGLDGIIIENQNVKALTEGLRILMSDKELRFRLGKRAIEDVKRFEVDKTIDRWEQMYKDLIFC